MRDIWTGGVSNDISIELKKTSDKGLSEITTILRVSADLKSIIYAVHKEFSLDANYPKGHGKIFRDWYLEAHAGEFLFHTERSNGSRQDIVAIGSMAIYYNRGVYLEFLDERMKFSSATSGDKNILQSCLFIQLGCVELAAAARLFCILYLSMVIPVRWFAAKTHKLSHRTVHGYAWGVRSMGLVADIIYEKYKEIKEKPTLILDEDYMMGMFDTLGNDIPEYKEYQEYLYQEKKSSFATRAAGARFVSYKLIREEAFNPADEDNRSTTEHMANYGKIAAQAMINEFESKKKVTRWHLTVHPEGRLSFNHCSVEEKKALVGKRATNDSAESAFSSFTDQLKYDMIDFCAAAGISDIKRNGYVNRPSTPKEIKGNKIGMMLCIPQNLRRAIVQTAMEGAPRVRKKN